MSRQSYQHRDKNVIFNAQMNSEAEELNINGGVSTDVTYADGVATFNGSAYITYSNKPFTTNDKTIVFRWKSSDTTRDYLIGSVAYPYMSMRFSTNLALYRWSATSYQYFNVSDTLYNDGEWHTAVLVPNYSDIRNSVLYIDGIAMTKGSGALVSAFAEGGFFIGSFFTGSVDYCLRYNIALTAEEVSALYKNELYVRPAIQGANYKEVLSINSNGGVITDKYGNTITNTGTVIRNGSNYCTKVNGAVSEDLYVSSSVLQGATNSSSFTIGQWIKINEPIIDYCGFISAFNAAGNGFNVYIRYLGGNNTLFSYTTNYSNYTFGNLGQTVNKCFRLIYIFDAGSISAYVNGVKIGSTGTGKSITGYSNIYFSRYFTNNITNARKLIINDEFITLGVWSAEEVARDFNSTKHNYNK